MWKLKFLFIALEIFFVSEAAGQFSDSFADGDFLNAPTWTGDAAKFVIQSERLRLLASPSASSAQLVTASQAIHVGQWEFSLQMDFTPSSSNYANVFLVSDEPDLLGGLNGYFVKIGNAAREVSLYRQTGTTETELIDGLDDRVNQPIVQVRVRVTRDADGRWELFCDAGHTGQFVSEGIAVDVEHTTSAWFGLRCVYTATRSDKFWCDDFFVSGTVVPNPDPPSGQPHPNSVLITEIFADPSPQVGLPAMEYIELHNPGVDAIDLKSWTFSDGSSTGLFPKYLLLPGDYLVVTSTAGGSLFPGAGVVTLANFPSLNNTGDKLLLTDKNGLAIDSVHYSLEWYRDEDKSAGGWSLELIDPKNPCGEADNWTSSEDVHGGTPGLANSVLANKPDLTPPEVIKVRSADSMNLEVDFNETLLAASVLNANVELLPFVPIDHVALNGSRKRLDVVLSARLQGGIQYRMKISRIKDCNGNEMEPQQLHFGLSEPADSLDVLLSEVLFNPRPGGVDFVEVHNASQKYVDLKGWTISNGDNEVTLPAVQIPPGGMLALTPDPVVLRIQYPAPAAVMLLPASLPSFPDDESLVLIYNSSRQLMDRLHYNDDWHSVFLQSTEGVSLERISFSAVSENKENWISAAAWSGFATPGFLNSNHRSNSTPTSQIVVFPEIFSPGGSTNDFVQIHYRYDRPGVVANFRIYDQQGTAVKILASNATMGSEGFLRWDGDRDNGSRANVGYYVLWVESFDVTGQVETVRTRIVIAAR